ncbi:hypothetical protein A3A49_02040 [Candidatus Curtissbacteria bacterium RIFCSPLOWO2_01_FULL_38_11b]|uniref:Uncharacterized protein n=1 Tax=Candidatus Curtissbacteria bacterium RIFCSPLOWO2_01_FULL_38_11b TaxID=1797725 RepID=A0A1F5H1N6_9BACT|nr:MAG: hypothetical protein A3A49_02040 [Candidatus Curtissbacteria bacterium RIFCSPLOWO2_01_FULL_38_11b]
MPIEGVGLGFINNISAAFGIKSFLLLFLVFYSVFALLLFRQVQIMNQKLPTSLSPTLRFVGILHVGVALAVLFLIAGIF